MSQHTIVVLGASMGGLPIAHWLMKHKVPSAKNLKVVLVSPNSDFYINVASVRAILPDTIADDQMFYPIAPQFSKYPQKDQFEFVVGKAESLDPASKTVVVAEVSGARRNINYSTLIIATGAGSKGGLPWKNLDSTAATKAALQDYRKRIGAAKSIVVAGGGQTGVEVAGELGHYYSSKGLKEVTFVIDDKLPLTADAREDVRRSIASRLESFKVRIVPSRRVTTVSASSSGDGGGKTVLELTSRDGAKTETLETDVYIPAVGVVPNSDFAPSSMLEPSGRIRQAKDLRAEGHEDIFVIGDVGNLQTASGKHVDDQVVQLSKALEVYLPAAAAAAPGGGKAAAALPEYKVDNKVVFVVALGPGAGAGQIGNFKMWSWLVRMFKSKTLGVQYAADIAAGNRTMMTTKW